ncbi:Transducin/WD40 repeat-like superfamily protein [Prunus dulcis]|uniref:Ribosome biogenesis protein WDR12 homolog n=1 Tax=Prunus dulcis TaxID=3755 RepID=A0A4Y1R7T5_PRUDU|nr:Transducin/WD40 repeat-like superfamily protein [Prunus dulcis]
MDTDGNSGDASRVVHVRFITKLDRPFKVPNSSISVASNFTRFGLSSVVNNLIQTENPDWEVEPFDFLINGELVRMSLENFLLAKGISAETILEIEYIRAVVPRKEEEPSLHDDWVSAVDGSSPRVWKAAGVCTHILEGHSEPVSSVSIINPEGADSVTVATASKDRTLDCGRRNPLKISAFKILRGHRASVQSVAAQTSGNMICSGSWDCTINLWQTNEPVSEGDTVSTKKRKTTGQAKESQSEGEAVSSLVGHTQCVSSVKWPERETIYSASWDHSIRRWNAETGKDSLNIFCGKALNCLDIGGESSALVAAGGSDPILKIWDPRKPGTSAPVYQFSSHTSWVTACKWHEKSWFHLISASHDGKWPLFVIDAHKDKALCADWWRGDTVLSGGADSKLCMTSGASVL